MTSDTSHETAFVWVWRPDSKEPDVAGRIDRADEGFIFTYGKSYLARKPAFSLYHPELPLKAGPQRPPTGMILAGCLRDGSPDAWGRRVINRHVLGREKENEGDLNELTYMLQSGSDRIGALDFQQSASEYIPRNDTNATLEELLEAAERIERDLPLTPDLEQAINHGSSVGGARPKALIQDGNRKYVAKFSSTSDIHNVVKAEFVAMRLAKLAGLDVATVQLARAAGKDVLLVERFDRVPHVDGWYRKVMISALTILELDEMMARYSSYQDLAEAVRRGFSQPSATNKELFSRLIFNILCGNTDDHARNHAAFWDGEQLTLTPAYDICPQNRSGQEASQGMLIVGEDNSSRLATCYRAAKHFGVSDDEARDIAESQRQVIQTQWDNVCDQAELSKIDRSYYWKRQFLNPYVDY